MSNLFIDSLIYVIAVTFNVLTQVVFIIPHQESSLYNKYRNNLNLEKIACICMFLYKLKPICNCLF